MMVAATGAHGVKLYCTHQGWKIIHPMRANNSSSGASDRGGVCSGLTVSLRTRNESCVMLLKVSFDPCPYPQNPEPQEVLNYQP
jgi:hypothetical protein